MVQCKMLNREEIWRTIGYWGLLQVLLILCLPQVSWSWLLTKDLPIIKHNTLYEPAPGGWNNLHSNGNGTSFIVGVNGHGHRRRGLLFFNATEDVKFFQQQGIQIVKIDLHLSVRKTRGVHTLRVDIYPATHPWGAGNSNANNTPGQGDIARIGDATWNHSFYNTVHWQNLGGDYNDSVIIATQDVPWFGIYTWSNPNIMEAILSWTENPHSNLGWLLKARDETLSSSAVEFVIAESKLTITYNGAVPVWFWGVIAGSSVAIGVIATLLSCLCNDKTHRYGTVRNVTALTKNPITLGQIVEDSEIRLVEGDELAIGEFIGHGINSTVYKGTLKGSVVAIKKVYSSRSASEDSIYGDCSDEIKIMSTIAHPNVLSLLALTVDSEALYIVTEYMDAGCLADLIYKDKGIEPWEEKIRILKEVAYGVHHLHSVRPRIIHRDLKPENILVNSLGEVKIADFGLSKMLQNYTEIVDSQGTAQYMAPEVIRKGKISEKSDVYSYGIIAWEIYACKKPYDDLSPFEVMFKVVNEKYRPPIPPACPSCYRKLILACTFQKHSDRISFKEVIQDIETFPLHPF